MAGLRRRLSCWFRCIRTTRNTNLSILSLLMIVINCISEDWGLSASSKIDAEQLTHIRNIPFRHRTGLLMDSERCTTTSWTTMCLFLATALASQLCQDMIRKREEKQWIQMRQRYHHKRLAERMSYDDLQDYLDGNSDDERVNNNGQPSHQQQVNTELVSPTKSAGDLVSESGYDWKREVRFSWIIPRWHLTIISYILTNVTGSGKWIRFSPQK